MTVAVQKDADEAEARIIEGLAAYAEGGPDLRSEWRTEGVAAGLDPKWIDEVIGAAAAERTANKARSEGDQTAAAA
jgi:hypothetical protein